ncbi:hypothetical protein CQW23_33024 [Capsicum baccatum]|uniref:Uncharacterized protein n=1 Tax=Capsicum baccatum TaxID=33114 RepID=A0A2G2V311_CAPBA|nr:hypothetical protein CQW23_33024 [Capsicum baccatum]
MSDNEDELQMDFLLDQSGGNAHDLMGMGFGLPTESEREDDPVDSFRKCVDQIQPFPENMQTKHYASGGKNDGGGGKGVRYGRGHGRGGRSRY